MLFRSGPILYEGGIVNDGGTRLIDVCRTCLKAQRKMRMPRHALANGRWPLGWRMPFRTSEPNICRTIIDCALSTQLLRGTGIHGAALPECERCGFWPACCAGSCFTARLLVKKLRKLWRYCSRDRPNRPTVMYGGRRFCCGIEL